MEHALLSKTLRAKTIAMPGKSYDDIHNDLTITCEKSKMVSFTFSIVKNIILSFLPLRFPVKLIYCIAFGSTSSACCLLKSTVIIFQCFFEIIVV